MFITDEDIDIRNKEELFNTILNNYTPRLDTHFSRGPLDILDHAAPQSGYGGKVMFDITKKLPEEGGGDTVKINNNLKKIDWMKIDVEGAELDVVNGAKKTLLDLKPNLIIEVISENMKKRGFSSILFKKMMLDEFAYLAFLIDNSGKILEDSADNENNSENLVFIHISNLKKIDY